MHRRRNLACEPFSEASDEACTAGKAHGVLAAGVRLSFYQVGVS